jgi:Divergent InlB B-repeat domain
VTRKQATLPLVRAGRLVSAVVVVLACFGALAHGARAAVPVTWCGNGALQSPVDRLPDATAGLQVHVIYAHPSDQPDRLGMFADAIASDAASADAWWRAQDSTRTVRYDTFGFAGCSGLAALDISDVTLAHDSAYFQPLSGVAGGDRYDKLVGDLAAHQSVWKKYVVYFDGPVLSPNTCGQGGGFFGTGPDYAFIYLQACNLATASLGYRTHVTTHELIHALGAVDSSAPHDCGGPNTGHVCDSVLDIMYWQAQPTTTIDTDILDLNHDDYYANGAANDIRKSAWLRQLDAAQLTSSVSVTGLGTVASDKPGLLCPPECSNTWDRGSAFTLTATAGDGQRFTGWGGACSGTSTCDVTMDVAKSVTATFAGQVRLTVSVDASRASGSVVSEPAGISCPGTCTATFDAGQAVKLVATPGNGSRLDGWGGACSGTASCNVVPDGTKTVSATFGRANRTLAVSVGGRGSVSSTPAGIACPGRCSRAFAADSVVALKAKPAAGYRFSGWTGACRGKGACSVKLANDASVRATFKKR